MGQLQNTTRPQVARNKPSNWTEQQDARRPARSVGVDLRPIVATAAARSLCASEPIRRLESDAGWLHLVSADALPLAPAQSIGNPLKWLENRKQMVVLYLAPSNGFEARNCSGRRAGSLGQRESLVVI